MPLTFIPVALGCHACLLFEEFAEKAAVGEPQMVGNLYDLPIGVAQHYLRFGNEGPVNPILCSFSPDLLDDRAEISWRETNAVGIIVKGMGFLHMLIDQTYEPVEYFLLMGHSFGLPLFLSFQAKVEEGEQRTYV